MEPFSYTLKYVLSWAAIGLKHAAQIFIQLGPLHQILTQALFAVIIATLIVRQIRRINAKAFIKLSADSISNYQEPATTYYRPGGFLKRVFLYAVDAAVVFCLITGPLALAFTYLGKAGQSSMTNGATFAVSIFAAQFLYLVLPMYLFQSTPAKRLVNMYIVDVRTFGKPSFRQCVVRAIGHLLSAVPFGLGYLSAAWDPKKQGWHDKLAKTMVIQKYDRPF